MKKILFLHFIIFAFFVSCSTENEVIKKDSEEIIQKNATKYKISPYVDHGYSAANRLVLYLINKSSTRRLYMVRYMETQDNDLTSSYAFRWVIKKEQGSTNKWGLTQPIKGYPLHSDFKNLLGNKYSEVYLINHTNKTYSIRFYAGKNYVGAYSNAAKLLPNSKIKISDFFNLGAHLSYKTSLIN